ncbi:hypothetical protein HN011_004945 [Eciton burchellii]|nr:hypothetical protein HN011_004945 [Eciton burchellii]
MILHRFAQSSCFVAFRLNLTKIFKCAYTNRGMSANAKFLSDSKSDLEDIFRCAVKAVSPYEIIRNKVKFRDNVLHVNEKSFPLPGNVYLVGFGKAVMGMAIELEKILGSVLKKGIVSVPSISKDAIWTSEDKLDFPKLYNSVIEYREGSINNQPDSRSLDTTHDIIDLVENLTEEDTLIVLVSGGGSALLYMPRPLLDQDDKLQLCKELQNAGANIIELNTVRRKLSLVKGGGLARMAYPASVIALILSDIVGDPVDLIASGPTAYNPKAPEHVIAILKKYKLYQSLEGDLKSVIISKEAFDDKHLLSPLKQFKHVTNLIIGNNAVALEAASLEAARKKLTPIILRNDVTGDVQKVSSAYAHVTSLICRVLLNELSRKEFYHRMQHTPILSLSADKVHEIFNRINNLSDIVLIGGGEPTVVVTGSGKGGRNQELALRFSLDWLAEIKSFPRLAEYNVMMFCGASDGQDGPTDVTGAFGYPAIAPMMHDFLAKVKSMANDVEEACTGTCWFEQKPKATGKRTLIHNLQKYNSSKMIEKSISAQNNNAKNNESNDALLALTIMEIERMLPENTLKENDTYNFYSRFKKGADLIKTGLTGTNVMDLHFIYIKKRWCKCDIEVSDEPVCKEDISAILNEHDLHIDESTIEKYKTLLASLRYDKDRFLMPLVPTEIKEEKSYPDIKIIDENFADPCCKICKH